MKRGSFYKLQMLLLAAALFVAISFLQAQLNRDRASLGLTRVTPLENAPPVLAFSTVALGGFRGLIANALWIRANDLQLEDKYFEQVQLSDWITKLEPSFVQVWVVQAWNMAYNISVKFRDPVDRWRWVQNGIELLRDQGLRYNPKEALIYRELAWFFQHKVGQTMDDAHLFYKYAWATNMTAALGSGRPNFDELLHPQTDDARHRAAVLREKFKMDPAVMKKIEDLYGPFDWRLPEPSAIYWATVGLEKSNKKDLVTLRRVVYQSLHTCVLRGRIVHVREDGSYSYGPDLSKIALANDGYEKMLAEENEKPEGVRRSHRNFLREVVYLLYTRNRIQEADRWLKVLKEKYPDSVPASETAEQYGFRRLSESVKDGNIDQTRALIENLLYQHFENLAIDEDDHAAGVLMMARHIWEFYDTKVQSRRGPLKLDPLPEMYGRIRDQLLAPQSGLSPIYQARLRTKLGLPAAAPPGTTNAPASPSPPKPK